MVQAGRRCAVLGDPISHSLSPVLHRAAYRSLGLYAWCYDQLRVTQDNLPAFINSLHEDWAGLSLTMPLKKTILPLGSLSDPWSRLLQVSNTAQLDWNEGGNHPHISLYNTDVEGIVCAFLEAQGIIHQPNQAGDIIRALGEGHPLEGQENYRSALIIGNGNTAESALCALHLLNIDHLSLVARHPQATGRMVSLAQDLGMTVTQVLGMVEGSSLISALDEAGLVVSTLPAHAADPLAHILLAEEGSVRSTPDGSPPPILLDVAYQPRPTLLAQAWRRSMGGLTIGGERMLLYQAVRQVSLMTGYPLEAIPVSIMDQSLKERIG